MRSFRRYLITAIALAVVTAGCSSHTTQNLVSPATTTIPATLTITTLPTVTTAQLNAHLGVGVLNGWDPVDEGEARVFVPSDWILEARGSCIGDPSAPGMISIGDLPQTNCTPASEWPIPTQAVAFTSLSKTRTGRPWLTIHGYRVYKGNPTTSSPPWTYYDVPQLDVRIVARGTLGVRVLETLAPSARVVALDPAYEIVPSKWHAVTENRVDLSIPQAWGIATPNVSCGLPVSDSELLLIKPDIGVAPCPSPPATPAAALRDGLSLYLPPHNTNAPNPTGKPIATIQHSATTITVYAEPYDPNVLDLFVHKSGSSITHVLTLGLGRDGRIAGGVLASIRAVT